ncbi:MAG: hypothetical protein Tsb0015_00040 [Simkaniaceae bacterium]
MNGEDILQEIDETLDKLLQNAAVLQQISNNPEYQEERNALEKTQDSLLAHLIHMDCLLEQEKISSAKRKKTATNISEKLSNIKRLDHDFIQKICDNFLKPISLEKRKKTPDKKPSKPQISKRRCKEFV